MKEAFLHIGVEKTGSTSIQLSMSKNRERLASEGILYPVCLGDRNHIACYAYASESGMDELKEQWSLVDSAAVEAFRIQIEEKFIEECNASGAETLCISNEHCSSRLLGISELKRLRELIHNATADIKVVIYIRDPVETLVSGYSQYIKTGGTAPFQSPDDSFIENRLNYEIIIARWGSVFGRDNIRVRLFDDDWLHGGDAVRDFASVLGLASDPFALDERKNRRLGRIGLETLRRFNRYLPGAVAGQINPARGNLGAILESIGFDEEFVPPRDIAQNLYKKLAASNERVRKEFFPERAPPLFRESKDDRPPSASVTEDQVIEAAVYVWKQKQEQVSKLTARVQTLVKKLENRGLRQ